MGIFDVVGSVGDLVGSVAKSKDIHKISGKGISGSIGVIPTNASGSTLLESEGFKLAPICYTFYTVKEEKKDKKPKDIVELEKLIETLESAGGGEEIKALIRQKRSEIRALEAKYDLFQVIVEGKEEKEDEDGNKFKLVFHYEGQRYYAEGVLYNNQHVILQETSDSDNGKGIKNGCIHFVYGRLLDKDDPIALYGVVQTDDNEIINISQTLFSKKDLNY